MQQFKINPAEGDNNNADDCDCYEMPFDAMCDKTSLKENIIIINFRGLWANIIPEYNSVICTRSAGRIHSFVMTVKPSGMLSPVAPAS